MIGAKYPLYLINTINQLYSKAHTSPLSMQFAVKIRKGVLQGGILSPILFTLYIDDLAAILEKD